jgi:hypothetical protein
MGVVDRSERIFSLMMKLRQVGRMQFGRIFGSALDSNGRYKAMIDLLERCYIMRAELNSIATILIEKKMITVEEWSATVDKELTSYFEAVSKDWPELEFKDDGVTIKDPKALAARSQREGWPP